MEFKIINLVSSLNAEDTAEELKNFLSTNLDLTAESFLTNYIRASSLISDGKQTKLATKVLRVLSEKAKNSSEEFTSSVKLAIDDFKDDFLDCNDPMTYPMANWISLLEKKPAPFYGA